MKPSTPASSATESAALYLSVADEIAGRIRAGELAGGERVPSVRLLAAQRKVSHTTALAALRHLESRGDIEARPQSGYYVRSQLSDLQPLATTRNARRPRYVAVNGLFDQLIATMGDRAIVQLGSALQEPGWFPTAALQRALSSTIRRQPQLLTEYGSFHGVEALRRAIARLYLDQGCPVSHEDIVITSGCTEALNLALRNIAKPGDTIAVESPTYYGFLQIIESLGMRALEIATDAVGGLSVAALRNALDANGSGSVRAVLLSPCVGNPLGTTMSEASKRELLTLCAARGVAIIEDDVHGDLHFATPRPPPLKALDRDGIVTLCSSFSKTLAPGMRIGWMFGGVDAQKLRVSRFMASVSTPVALQSCIADVLTQRGYQRQLRGLRQRCQQQVAQFSRAVERYFPAGTRMSRPNGGYVLWLDLPGEVDTVALHGLALARNISFAPGPLFSASGQFRSAMRLNCGRELSPTVIAALKQIGKLAGA
ncbi:PLP-dependent aminotransferase family protein [Hydrocarboniphaga sp.]|uniref:aminotransferase-like domain-containing protein n=1 Tax=Hydrocarboniphaga sp. TaxID=2033016 RepID=UPI003D0E4ADF